MANCKNLKSIVLYKILQGVQGLQAFAFSVVTVKDEHTKPLDLKESVEVKFKEGICAKLCLTFWFESDWYFCNITKSRWF